MGCVSYLASVVLMSYRDLGPIPFWKWTALSIGVSPSPVQPRTVARGLAYMSMYMALYTTCEKQAFSCAKHMVCQDIL
jgi:hypothetical protein